MNWHNDNDPDLVPWLNYLMDQGLVPEGYIDTRSIEEIQPSEIKDFSQCHFFCGILGWVHALELAGWPTNKPVWTASLPCQPFSIAGRRKGKDDERHLWPVFRDLVRECRPPIIFGEQVSSTDGWTWWGDVQSDLEEIGYASGAVGLSAAGVGAPHIRKRIYWVAFPYREGLEGHPRDVFRGNEPRRVKKVTSGSVITESNASGARLGITNGAGQSRHKTRPQHEGWPVFEPTSHTRKDGWVQCEGAKIRPIEPRICPVVDGLPARMVRTLLKGYGNAIVPQVAAEFIAVASAWMQHD